MHDRNSSKSFLCAPPSVRWLLSQSYHSFGRWMLFLLGIAGFSSCHLEDFDKEIPYDPVFVVPVGELTYTGRGLFEKLIAANAQENLILEEDEEGVLRFVYYWDTTFYFDEHLPRLMDNMSDHNIVQPEDMPVLPTEQSFEIYETQYSELMLDNNRLDSVLFTGGELAVQAVSTYPPELRSMVFLPTLQRQSTQAPLNIPFDFVYENNMPPSQDQTQIYPLRGYKFMQFPTPTGNRFETQYRIRSDIAAGVRVERGNAIRYSTAFRRATFDHFYGHIAPKSFRAFDHTGAIEVLQNFGEVFFANPSIHIDMKNAYGIPFTLLLEGTSFVTTAGDTRRLTGDVIRRPQFVDAPSIERVGTYERSHIVIHAQNSNIAQAISSIVNLVHLPVHVHFNPAPPFEQFSNHFFTDESKVEMHTRMELPLDLVFDSLIYDMRFLNEGLLVDVPEQAETGVLRLRTLNALPVEGIITFSFMKNGEVIYRIPKEKRIRAPEMREDGTVIEPHENRIALPLDKDELHEYKQADETRVRFEFSTPTNAQGERISARFYATDGLVLQLSIRVDTSF